MPKNIIAPRTHFSKFDSGKKLFFENRTHRGTSQAERRRDVGKIQRIAVIVPTSLTNLCQ